MDTNKAAYEVPTFKVARVGNDRKRRGGGLPWLRGSGGGARGVWSGAGGAGSGASVNVLGMTMSKTLLAVMVTCGIGSASIYAGNMSASGDASVPAEKPKIFVQEKNASKYEGDVSNLPTNPNSIPNSMGYVSGSIDGLTPEERAKKAAEAAEAQRKADEEAKKAEEANASADNGGHVDPAALLASAKADGGKQAGALGRKFGQLNTGTGGGSALAGGAGLSGGVGRSFSAASLNNTNAGTLAALSKSGSKPTYARSRAATASSKTKGFARQQLMNANTLSRAGAAAGRGETASYEAASAFDNNTGAGTAITGAGMGTEGNSGGAKPTPNAAADGGPTGQTPACSGTQYPDPNTGACVSTSIPKSKNATPWQNQIDIAQALLVTISVLAGVCLLLSATGYGLVALPFLEIAILALAAIVTGLGISIMAQGDYAQGAILTAVGGFILVAGAMGIAGMPFLSYTATMITAGAGALLGQAAKMLTKTPKGAMD